MQSTNEREAAGQAHDPVCGMVVDGQTAKHRTEYEGATQYFCCARCREKFLADPAQYSTPRAKPTPSTPGMGGMSGASSTSGPPIAPSASGTEYTCPMHPEIRRTAPGSCPICGMALEPVTPTAASEPNPELRDMTRRFWVGVVLAAPMLVLEMGGHLGLSSLHRHVSPAQSMWAQLIIGTPIVFWCGWPFFERAWHSVLNRALNMFSLIGLGVGAAYLCSLAATFAPGWFPAGLRQ